MYVILSRAGTESEQVPADTPWFRDDGSVGSLSWRLKRPGRDTMTPSGGIPVWHPYLYEDSDGEWNDVDECERPEDG